MIFHYINTQHYIFFHKAHSCCSLRPMHRKSRQYVYIYIIIPLYPLFSIPRFVASHGINFLTRQRWGNGLRFGDLLHFEVSWATDAELGAWYIYIYQLGNVLLGLLNLFFENLRAIRAIFLRPDPWSWNHVWMVVSGIPDFSMPIKMTWILVETWAPLGTWTADSWISRALHPIQC